MKVTISKEDMTPLVEQAAAYARRILVEDQQREMMPVWHLISSDSDMPSAVVGTPWSGDSEKRQAVAAVKHMSREMNAEAVIFSCEVWFVKLDRGQRMRGDRPAESPDRIEAVMIVAVNRQGDWVMRHLLTIRDKPGGRIITLKDDPESPGTYESWMFDGMFNPEPAQPSPPSV